MVKVQITGLWDTVRDGCGMGLNIFFAGCTRGCTGCHNPELQDFGVGYECDTDDLISYIKMHGEFYESVVFTGGDPVYQLEALKDLASKVDRTKVLYTGALIEDLPSVLVADIDIIVDGPYVQELATKGFPASSNQRVICSVDLRDRFMRNKL